jgi:hypothetical protein
MLFLAKGRYETTPWDMVTEKGQIELLHKLWEWAIEVLTQEELNIVSSFDKRECGKTAWHMVSEKDQIEILNRRWD